MPLNWNDVKKWLGDATNTAVKESRELARKGKIQVDIMSVRHQTTLALTELGSTVYEMLQKDKDEEVGASTKVKELVSKIHGLELELRRKQKEQKAKKYV